ncbi:MAG: M48 family metallopeptidase [Lachnospiraceae bacterium]|nr:M48 family metallopeptidase [Lachnospiraceae bacterium]
MPRIGGIEYELSRKAVKNINMRIKQDGRVLVSAGPFVPLSRIEAFVASKSAYIKRVLRSYEQKREALDDAKMAGILPDRDYGAPSVRRKALALMEEICESVYPHFAEMGVRFPVIRMRNMKTQWGSCRPAEGILTFNTKLLDVPRPLAEYVAVHEFAHFLHPNHQAAFWTSVEQVLPDYRKRRSDLKQYTLL